LDRRFDASVTPWAFAIALRLLTDARRSPREPFAREDESRS
jgi:hypothetical protein